MRLFMRSGLLLWLRAGISLLTLLSLSACAFDDTSAKLDKNTNKKIINEDVQSSESSSASSLNLARNTPVKGSDLDEKPEKQIKPDSYYVNYTDHIYQILLAEYHYQHADYEKSSYLYSALLPQDSGKPKNSAITPSVALYRRATELAIKIDDHDRALRSAQQWKKLEPESSTVNQFLVLLYQKSKQYEKSADILADLVKSYPVKNSKTVDIAVALLEQQAEAKDAYQTLKHFSQKHIKPADNTGSTKEANESANESTKEEIKEVIKQNSKGEEANTKTSRKSSTKDETKNVAPNKGKKKGEQNGDVTYYLAIFAMRAKRYEEVLATTDNLGRINDNELKRKAALLRIKAYTALEKPEKALVELKALIAEAADIKTRQTYARIMASLGKSEEAVAMLDQSFEKHPEDADLLLDIIAINLGNEKFEESLPYLDKLQPLDGQATNAHYFRGVIFESLERYPEALLEYNAIEKDKQSMQVYSRIAFVLVKQESLESALSFLHEKQDQHDSENYKRELYLLESEILREAHSYDKALEANKKALELAPMDLDILYSRALLHEDADQIGMSEEQLLKIIKIDSDHSSALNALGYLLSVHTQRFDEAYEYIKKAYDLKPNDPAIIDSLGWVSYRKGDLKDAEKYLRQAYKKLKDPEVASHLVEVLAKQGHKEEASTLLAEMLKKHPKNKKLIKAQSFIEKSE